MLRFVITVTAAFFSLAAETASAAPGDAAAGATLFNRRCAMCHSVDTADKSTIGPDLTAVVGRKSAATSYAYSPALKAAGIIWTAKNLDMFLASPSSLIKANKMGFGGLSNVQDRADIIAFLATRKK